MSAVDRDYWTCIYDTAVIGNLGFVRMPDMSIKMVIMSSIKIPPLPVPAPLRRGPRGNKKLVTVR